MTDILDDLFGNINKIDPLGPYQSREMKVEVVNGEERLVEVTRTERETEGVWNVTEQIRYLCQSCGTGWVTPGLDGFSQNKRVLCNKCSRKTKIKRILKPFWSPFIKFEDDK